jgi:hypothetical protein
VADLLGMVVHPVGYVLRHLIVVVDALAHRLLARVYNEHTSDTVGESVCVVRVVPVCAQLAAVEGEPVGVRASGRNRALADAGNTVFGVGAVLIVSYLQL